MNTESMISEEYGSFILTIGCITVAIVYSPDDGHFKCSSFIPEIFMERFTLDGLVYC